jgi:hypothetical protein
VYEAVAVRVVYALSVKYICDNPNET